PTGRSTSVRSTRWTCSTIATRPSSSWTSSTRSTTRRRFVTRTCQLAMVSITSVKQITGFHRAGSTWSHACLSSSRLAIKQIHVALASAALPVGGFLAPYTRNSAAALLHKSDDLQVLPSCAFFSRKCDFSPPVSDLVDRPVQACILLL